jgi:hypothetical protein
MDVGTHRRVPICPAAAACKSSHNHSTKHSPTNARARNRTSTILNVSGHHSITICSSISWHPWNTTIHTSVGGQARNLRATTMAHGLETHAGHQLSKGICSRCIAKRYRNSRYLRGKMHALLTSPRLVSALALRASGLSPSQSWKHSSARTPRFRKTLVVTEIKTETLRRAGIRNPL